MSAAARWWARRHRPMVMVWPLAVGQIIAFGSVFYSFSLFVTPIRAELGWSLEAINGALTVAFFATALMSYPVGRFIDNHGGRAVMVAGCVTAGVALIALSFTQSLAAFYVGWCVIGVSMAGILYDPAFIVITQVFGKDAKRGITYLTLIAGFASTVFIPLIEFLLAAIGWRATLVTLGIIVIGLGAPINGIFVPPRVTRPSRQSDNAGEPGGDEFSLLTFVRQPIFVGLMIWSVTYSFILTGLLFQLVPLLKSEGVSTSDVVICMAVFGPMQVFGRATVMLIDARVSTAAMGTIATTTFPIATGILCYAPREILWLVIAVGLFGAANGIATIVRASAPAEWIGLDHYGRMAALISVPVIAAGALAPALLAWIWANFGAARMLESLVVVSVVSLMAYHVARACRRRAG